MMQLITYQHYRPMQGDLERNKLVRGSTPEWVVSRYYRGKNAWRPDPKGGITYCFLRTVDNEQFAGIGNCSVTDTFCFAMGRHYAFKDAVNKMLNNKGMKAPVNLEDEKIALVMPLEHGRTIARYLKTFLNNSAFSDTARNELYKAIQYVRVHGLHS